MLFFNLLFVGASLSVQTIARAEPNPARNVVIITDVEPDDRIALDISAARLSGRLKMVGTTVKNSFRKAALVKNQLKMTLANNVPVIVGAGGEPHDYPEIASSAAAREYSQEGDGILSEETLANLKNMDAAKGSNKLQIAWRNALIEAIDTGVLLEVAMLAPPTDLVAVISAEPMLKRGIGHIHIMGGWVETPVNPATGLSEKRSTYNWNMDPKAASDLMKMSDIPMTLYSSDIIKPNFAGGSVNKNNYPEIIEMIEKSEAPGLKAFRKAGMSWDTHLMEKIPFLRNVIGENAGRQFTPADPLVIIGMLNPNLVTSSVPVDVDMVVTDLDSGKGFRVDVKENQASKIRLVRGLDTAVFEAEMIKSLNVINQVEVERKATLKYRAGGNICGKLFAP